MSSTEVERKLNTTRSDKLTVERSPHNEGLTGSPVSASAGNIFGEKVLKLRGTSNSSFNDHFDI